MGLELDCQSPGVLEAVGRLADLCREKGIAHARVGELEVWMGSEPIAELHDVTRSDVPARSNVPTAYRGGRFMPRGAGDGG